MLKAKENTAKKWSYQKHRLWFTVDRSREQGDAPTAVVHHWRDKDHGPTLLGPWLSTLKEEALVVQFHEDGGLSFSNRMRSTYYAFPGCDIVLQ